MGRWQSIAFLDDSSTKTFMGINVIGSTSNLSEYINDYEMFVGIGDNNKRKELYDIVESLGLGFQCSFTPMQ